MSFCVSMCVSDRVSICVSGSVSLPVCVCMFNRLNDPRGSTVSKPQHPPHHHHITRKPTGSSDIPLHVPARLRLVASYFYRVFYSAIGFGFARFLRNFCVRCFFFQFGDILMGHCVSLILLSPLFVRSPGEACNVIV